MPRQEGYDGRLRGGGGGRSGGGVVVGEDGDGRGGEAPGGGGWGDQGQGREGGGGEGGEAGAADYGDGDGGCGVLVGFLGVRGGGLLAGVCGGEVVVHAAWGFLGSVESGRRWLTDLCDWRGFKVGLLIYSNMWRDNMSICSLVM